MKVVTKYIAEDDTSFDTQVECEKHECQTRLQTLADSNFSTSDAAIDTVDFIWDHWGTILDIMQSMTPTRPGPINGSADVYATEYANDIKSYDGCNESWQQKYNKAYAHYIARHA